MEKGYVHIYTGNGKGKTTAAFGLALRAAMSGKKVYIGQFIKGMAYEETKCSQIIPQIKIEQFGTECFIDRKPGDEDIRLARKGLDKCMNALCSGEYDMVIMDIMMPVMDGITALKNLRKRGSNIPVLMLTAKTEIDDKVEGLDNGANDYLTKPFDTRELLARIRVLTRSEKQQDNVITLGNISLNTTTCELSSPSGSFLLTNKEYQMMLMFMNNKTQVISAEHFMEKIWDSESDSDISTVWTYISYLRRKLEALKSDYSIATRRNMGYYLKNNN